MKTAVSIPDHVLKSAEQLAKRTKRSRSRLITDALVEYTARHSPESITADMNRAIAELGQPSDEFVPVAARRILERSEW